MKYQVKDNQTGESFTYEGNSPPTSYDIEQQRAAQMASQPPQQIDSSGGLGNIPLIGGAIRNITNYAQDLTAPLLSSQSTSLAEQKANQANEMIKLARAEKDPTKKMYYLNQAGQLGQSGSNLSEQALSTYSPDINQPYIQRGFSTAANIASLADLANFALGSPAIGAFKSPVTASKFPGLGWLPKSISGIGPTSSPGLISRIASVVKNIDLYKSLPARMDKLAADAAKSGKSMSADKFLNTFKQNVQEMYDPNASINPTTGEWDWADANLKDYVNGVESYVRKGGDTLSPQKLIDLRRYFTQQLPSGLFQKSIMGRTPATNIFEAARRTATESAKEITPGLARTDSLYSLLRTVLGPNELSALERIGIAGGGLTLWKLLQGLLGGGGPSSFSAGTAPVQ